MLIWAKGYIHGLPFAGKGGDTCAPELPRGDSRIAIGGDTRLLFEVETPSLSPSPTKLIRGTYYDLFQSQCFQSTTINYQ